MSNGESTALGVRSIFHFLYVDSNLINWYELDAALNPPNLPERSLVDKYWKEKHIHQNYDLLFTYASNFQEAIYSVVNHNVDEAYLAMGRKYPFNCPFNGIIFELKTGASPEIYRWNHFLKDLSSLGLKNLQLTDGFVAFGRRFNDEIRETLMRHNTRKVIKYKKFSVEQLKGELLDYFNLINEPKGFEIEQEVILNNTGQMEYVDRRVKLELAEQGRRTLHLSRIMIVNEEVQHSYLVPAPKNDDFSVFEVE